MSGLVIGKLSHYHYQMYNDDVRRKYFDDVTKFDGIWFHEWDLHLKKAQDDMPRSRHPSQLYFHFNMEPPTKIMQVTYATPRSGLFFQHSHNFMNDYFNITMSYQRKSDIQNPYGYIVLQNETISQLSDGELKALIYDFARKNVHMADKSPSPSGAVVTQFVSNCNSTSGR